MDLAISRSLRSNDPCWCGSGKKFKRCHKPSQLPLRPGRVGPPRPVPGEVARPEYADSGQPGPPPLYEIAPPEVIARMRTTCSTAAGVLEFAGGLVAPGVTTDRIDELVHEAIVDLGAYPSPLNYKGYPKSICTSINEVICHGIPDDRALAEGDIVNVDVTIYLDGVHGDLSATYPVGVIDEPSKKLLEVTEACMWDGIEAVAPGRPISDIGKAIQERADAHGYGVVRAFIGHGVGERFHAGLQVPHHYDPAARTIMKPGMIFTIEPMITTGAWTHRVWPDGWTAVTTDGGRTAQFEHTVLVTESGVEVLTRA